MGVGLWVEDAAAAEEQRHGRHAQLHLQGLQDWHSHAVVVVGLVLVLVEGCSEGSDDCGSHGTARETAQTAHGWAGVVRQELVFGGGYEMRTTLGGSEDDTLR